MSGETPRSVTVAVVVATLVAAAALGAAAVLRWRASQVAAPALTSQRPVPTSTVGPDGCLDHPCTVLATTTVGGTTIELVADKGFTSGRVRLGGPKSGDVIEATITELGVRLDKDSLQCVPGGPSACLIRGVHDTGVLGQVVVGRSDKWSPLEKRFAADAGYLALANVDGDSEPEILAAQHDCPATDLAECTERPVFVRVFGLTGEDLGCTRNYARVDRLPGYPTVQVTQSQLTRCE